MFRTPFLIPIILVFIGSTLFSQKKSFNSLVAVVNGQAITESEVQEVTTATKNIIMLSFPEGPERDERLKSLRTTALNSLIERELILSEFIKMGGIIKDEVIDQDIQRIIDEEPFNGDRNKFLEEVKKAGTTMKRYKDQRKKILSVEIMKSRQAKSIKVVTPQKMKETYIKNKDRFRNETFARIRTITIRKNSEDPTVTAEDQKSLINSINEKIKNGADFSELAKLHSEDSVADKGGDRGVLGESSIELRRDLKAAAFSLKSNEVSEILEDKLAFYLIKAEDKKLGTVKPLTDETVKEEINNLALLDLRRSAYDRWMTKLKKTASIRRFDSEGKLITKSNNSE